LILVICSIYKHSKSDQMTNYDDYDDFQLSQNFGSKSGSGSKRNSPKKEKNTSCYSSKHVRRVTEITSKTKSK